MAVQIPQFRAHTGSGSSMSGFGQGMAQFGESLRAGRERSRQEEMLSQQKAEQEAMMAENQAKLAEGSIVSSVLYESDPEAQNALLDAFIAKADNEDLKASLMEFRALPPNQRMAVGRASLIEDGLPNLVPKAVEDKNTDTIRTEVRGRVGKDLAQINKDASAIKTNYNKLKNLSKEIESGNRQATAQGLIALVKIGDPGSTVRSEEMKDALNQQNPVAAVAALLASKGTSDNVAQAVMATFDPLSPDIVDINDFMSTANALVSANVPSIQDRYQAASELASGNLTERGYKSIFSPRIEKNIMGLSDMMKPDGGSVNTMKSEYKNAGDDQKKIFIQNATPEELEAAGVSAVEMKRLGMF